MKPTVIHVVNSNVFSGLESVACDIINGNNDEYNQIYVTRNGSIVNILKKRKVSYEIIKKVSTKEIRQVIKKYNPDIIHAHDFTTSCICALTLTKIPIISHLHHDAPWLKKINLKTLMYLLCSHKIKLILTVSDSIQKEYVFSNFIKNKIMCIGNPVSVKKIQSKVPKNVKKEYDVCCVGRLTKAKNPLLFVKIISEIVKIKSDLKVIWVGDGEEKKAVINTAKMLGIIHNIDFVGFKENPYIYMAKSKIFLLTSKWEGYGLVAFEALSLGLPCVVSNVGGLPNIVDNTCGYICNSENDFKISILEIINNENIYKKLSFKSLKRAEKLDNFEDYLMTIDKIYESVIKNES